MDYRGYGKSDGAFPSESQVYDDAEAAWDYLIRQRHVDPGRAFIYGHSMGGVVAIELALRRPEAAGLMVESAFTSMTDMARMHYWMFPIGWLLNQRFDALAKLQMLSVPVLLMQGNGDAEVPYTFSERLFYATRVYKALKLVPGGVVAETEQIFSNAAAVLRAAGLSLDDDISVRVFLTRIEDYQAMNAIYARHFSEPFPVRTAIGAAALPLGASVEIDMIAKGADR